MRPVSPGFPVGAGPLHPRWLGPYQVLEHLGKGGMGVVFKARHYQLNRLAAVKILRGDHLDDPHMMARFRREVEVISSLDHPHIVRALDTGEAGGCPYLVMEYVDGLDLSVISQLCGPLPVPDACELVRQAALGLQYAHENGLIHRDIKPSNLMLATGECVKILDLGLARAQEVLQDGKEMTTTGQVLGTADYLAPEHASGSKRVDIRADLYSLGCTLYRLLAGQPPFAGPNYDSVARKMWAHANEAPPPLSEYRSDLPEGLTAVLDRLLAKSPLDRYATPAEVADALEPFAQGANLRALLQTAQIRHAERVRQLQAEVQARVSATTLSVTQRISFSGRRPRLWRFSSAAGLLLVVLLVVAFQGCPKMAHPPPKILPGGWRELLDRPPHPLNWLERSGRWDYKEREQEVWLTTGKDGGLLRLSESSWPVYEIEVEIQQAQWGKVGLFFNYHDTTYPNGDQIIPCQRFEVIHLQARANKPAGTYYTLERSLIIQLPNGQSVHNAVTHERVADPKPNNQKLRIRFRHGAVEQVYWGEDPVNNLRNDAIKSNQHLAAKELWGFFGIYAASNTSSVFRNVRYRILEAEAP